LHTAGACAPAHAQPDAGSSTRSSAVIDLRQAENCAGLLPSGPVRPASKHGLPAAHARGPRIARQKTSAARWMHGLMHAPHKTGPASPRQFADLGHSRLLNPAAQQAGARAPGVNQPLQPAGNARGRYVKRRLASACESGHAPMLHTHATTGRTTPRTCPALSLTHQLAHTRSCPTRRLHFMCMRPAARAPLAATFVSIPRLRQHASMPRAGAGALVRLRCRSAHAARRAGAGCESSGRQAARAARGGESSGRLRLLAA